MQVNCIIEFNSKCNNLYKRHGRVIVYEKEIKKLCLIAPDKVIVPFPNLKGSLPYKRNLENNKKCNNFVVIFITYCACFAPIH